MTEKLKKILAQFNPDEPYVWRLHLSKDTFSDIEKHIAQNAEQMRGELSTNDARLVVIYWAEWYKRKYKGSEKGQTNAASDIDPKKVWEASGLDINRYVYKTDSGTQLWKYSTYVLGGLAVRHELSRNDNHRFLKALCRMFHGEDYTLENLDDANRAIAFRQSIIQKHSLYEYLKSILNGKSEHTEEPETRDLIDTIQTANNEVLHKKFSIEWIVENNPTSANMKRWLKVWLKPEEVGGKLHQYLRYDRLQLWGISNPEKLETLFFGLQWRNNDKIIAPLDKQKPFLTYNNTTDGFVSWGTESRFAIEKDIPSIPFTHLDIVAYDADDNRRIAQTEEATTWLQLWRTDDGLNRWSSKQQPQHSTAVIFTNQWHCIANSETKPFKNKQSGLSDAWNWCYIQSDITLNDKQNKPLTLYNRTGYDQVFITLHNETICYRNGGLVTMRKDDEEEGEIKECFPLIFGKEDLNIRHFRTKDAIANAQMESEEVCQDVRFKQDGHYTQWTEEEKPTYGLVQLSILDKGKEYKQTAVYLKGPILRNCSDNTIKYYDLEGKEQIYQDQIEMDKQPLHPSITLKIGDFEVEVYRPTLLKEIYLDGNVARYVGNGETFILPWIYKNRVAIADYSENGYKWYECKNIKTSFAQLDNELDKGKKDYMLFHLCEHTNWQVPETDADAPKWLRLSLSKETTQPNSAPPLLMFNIYEDADPQPFVFEKDHKKKSGEVIFQDARHPDDDLSFYYTDPGRPDPFATNKVKNNELRCFEIGVKYQLYFSIFFPLRQLVQKDDFDSKLLFQLKEKYGDDLPKDLKEGLYRMAEEFQIDINKIKI